MPPDSAACRRCGAPLTGGVPGGVCAACFGGGLFSGELLEPPLQRIGDYELGGEIGRGGMGVVFRARQISLNRPAAVKLILTGPLASAVERQRFVAEASAAAALEHPGIVAVYDAGEEDGQPFYAMQLVEGESLWHRLTNGVRFSPLEAATLIRSLALAVQHAHDRGFLHRDLKPANILMDHRGAPHIADFGLARRVDDDSRLTLPGAAVGTPSYMAPEQMDTRQPPTTAVDIYSLGAILYELLSGRPPFTGKSLPELFMAIREDQPLPLALTKSSAGRDLEVICRKCLEKNPAHRYASARHLADDLQRWLEGEPIAARAASRAERMWRWSRRRPALAALTGVAVLSFLGGLGGILWQWNRADHEAKAAQLASRRADTSAREARRALYAADMNLCQAALRNNNLGRARRLLDAHRPAPGAEDLRGWEWRYLWAQCRSAAVERLPAAPVEIRGLAGSADGAFVVINDLEGRLVIHDLSGGSAPREFGTGFDSGALAAAPDGKSFLCSLNATSCEMRDFSGAVLRNFPLTGALRAAAFSPEGEMVAVQTVNGTVRIFETANAGLKHEISLPPIRFGHGGGVAFLPGSPLRLAVASGSGIRIFSNTDGTETSALKTPPGNHVSALAVSPDGQFLAAGFCYADETVRVWDTVTGALVATLDGHTSWISSLLFTRDGATLYVGSADQTISIWKTADWTSAGVLRGHSDEIRALALSGGVLLSSSKNGEVLRWPTGRTGLATGRFEFPEGTLTVLDAGSSRGLLSIRPGFVRRWQPGAWQSGPEYPLPAGEMSMSNSGLLAVRRPDGKVLMLDGAAEPPAVLTELDLPPGSGMSCDADRRWAIFWHDRGRMTLVDLATWQARLIDAEAAVRAFSFDGSTGEIVVWTSDKNSQDYALRRYQPATHRWSAPELIPADSGNNRSDEQLRWMANITGTQVTLTRLKPFERVFDFNQENGLASLCFSGRSNWLAVANESAVARLWQLPVTGLPGPPRILQGHLNSIHSLAFTPDESRLVTLCSNREAAKFWDTATGQEMLTLGGNASLLMYARFTRNGETLLASRPGEGRFWQAWHAPSLGEIERQEMAGRW